MNTPQPEAHSASACVDDACDHMTFQGVEGESLSSPIPMTCLVCGRPAHYTDAGGYRHDHDGTTAGPDVPGYGCTYGPEVVR